MIKHLQLGNDTIWINTMIRNEADMCRMAEKQQKASTTPLSRTFSVPLTKRKRTFDQTKEVQQAANEPSLQEETTQLSP